MQKTIKYSAKCSGRSITGQYESSVSFTPAPPDTGIVFIRDDLPGKPEVECVTNYASTPSRWTSLVKDNIQIEHTEHLLAAIRGLQIDNIRVHLDSPHIPVVSHFSCKDFVDALLQAEPVSQNTPKRYLTITKPQWVIDSFIYEENRYDSILIALPNPETVFTYLLDYPGKQLPTQIAHYQAGSDKDFVTELSAARSFIMDYEFDSVAKLIGTTMDQCLVISKEAEANLNWENEPARHKLVDLIGDIGTVGKAVKGHFIGIRTGHKSNISMAKKLLSATRTDSA